MSALSSTVFGARFEKLARPAAKHPDWLGEKPSSRYDAYVAGLCDWNEVREKAERC